MPAFLPEQDITIFSKEAFLQGPLSDYGESLLRNAGILLGLFGIACTPLIMPLGVALIAGGMECIWLTSPGMV